MQGLTVESCARCCLLPLMLSAVGDHDVAQQMYCRPITGHLSGGRHDLGRDTWQVKCEMLALISTSIVGQHLVGMLLTGIKSEFASQRAIAAPIATIDDVNELA